MDDAERHPGSGVIAARAREPRDKVKVESVLGHTGCDNTNDVWGRQFQLDPSSEM